MVGRCAGIIASHCEGMDGNAAYVLGLLHDVGRREGICGLRHILYGYRFMTDLGFADSTRICLTHSFPYKDMRAYNGENDCTETESMFIRLFLEDTTYDDYDRLIQLCDALAFPHGPTYVEKRLVDVVIRRGFNDYTILKWQAFLECKACFDGKTGRDIYSLIL